MDKYKIYPFIYSGIGAEILFKTLDINHCGQLYLPYDDLEIEDVRDQLIEQGYLPEGYKDYLEIDLNSPEGGIWVSLKPNGMPIYRLELVPPNKD